VAADGGTGGLRRCFECHNDRRPADRDRHNDHRGERHRGAIDGHSLVERLACTAARAERSRRRSAATPTRPLGLFIQIQIGTKFAKLIASNILSGPYIATVLSNLPQTPFTNFVLTFHGGANALVMTPPCRATVGVGGVFRWSGNPGKFAIGPVTITQTSTGAPCP
jgi:hypothetical protein